MENDTQVVNEQPTTESLGIEEVFASMGLVTDVDRRRFDFSALSNEPQTVVAQIVESRI